MFALLKPGRRRSGVVGKRPDWRRRFDQVASDRPACRRRLPRRLTRPPLTVCVRACGIPGNGSTPTYARLSRRPHARAALIDRRQPECVGGVGRHRADPEHVARELRRQHVLEPGHGSDLQYKAAGGWPEPSSSSKILQRPQRRPRVAAVRLARSQCPEAAFESTRASGETGRSGETLTSSVEGLYEASLNGLTRMKHFRRANPSCQTGGYVDG